MKSKGSGIPVANSEDRDGEMATKSANLKGANFRGALLHNLRTITPGILIVLLALTGLFWIQVYVPLRTGNDLQGAVLISGTGTVTGAAEVLTGYRSAVPGYTIKLKEQTVRTKTSLPVRVCQQVLVKYRVGKSGVFYVDHIEAL